MQLSVEEIKKGIIHPEPVVRQQALNYFAESWTTDATVMTLAVEAMKTYGWDDAFKWVGVLTDVPQTPETFLWFASELEKGTDPSVNKKRNFAHVLSTIIAAADIELLREHQAKILKLPELARDARSEIKRRVQMSHVDLEECWRELEAVCEEARDGDHGAVDIGAGDLLAEAIGRDHRAAERILKVVSTRVDADNHVMTWMQGFLVQAAGHMRLAAAIPALVARFHVASRFGDEDAAKALAKIGGDAAAEAICHDFALQPRHYRYNSLEALEDIRSPLVVSKCLEFLTVEKDEEIKETMVMAALNNFASEAIDPARRFAAAEDSGSLKERLVGVATLMDVAFPELSTWKQELEDEARGIKKKAIEKPKWAPAVAPRLPAPRLLLPATPRSIKSVPKVGRNDPCPCGSGKKYKKCCMDK